MKVIIEETGKVDFLTILDANGIDWTADLIEAGGRETNDDGMVILSQEDFNWWTNYINEYEQTEEEIDELVEELEENVEITGMSWSQYVNEEISKNTGNDYEDHRKAAVEVMNEIREKYLPDTV